MVNIKLTSIMVLVLVFPFFLIGCWDRTEVSGLAIVVGTGIDQIPGKEPVLLTVQIINPSAMKQGQQGGGSQGSPYVLKTSRGKSLYDAIRNLTKDSARRIYFDHNKTVILGKDFAKFGVTDSLDSMERNKEFRRNNFVLVADITAKEVLGAQMDLENLPAESLEELLMQNIFTYPVNRNDFLLGMKYIGVSVAPVIQLTDQKKILVEKTAVFKNYRLIGFLTENESKDLLWLRNQLKEDSVVISPRTKKGEEVVTVDIIDGNTSITPRKNEEGITMEIKCMGKALLREAGNSNIEINKQEKFMEFERETEKILKKRVEHLIKSAQTRFKADFIGFANNIHNSDPLLWDSVKKDWDKNFSQVKYNVNFDINIINIGVIGDSVNQNDIEGIRP